MTYKLCLRLIEAGRTEGLADKIDVYYAANRLNTKEYEDLISKLSAE